MPNNFGLDWGPNEKPGEMTTSKEDLESAPKYLEELKDGLRFGVGSQWDMAHSNTRNQMQVDNTCVIQYLPNADFRRWFGPVFNRMAMALALSPFVVIVLGATGLLTPTLALATSYLQLFKMFLTAQALPEISGLITFCSSISGPVFLVLGMLVAYLTWRILLDPDVIYINPYGMILGKSVDRDKNYTSVNVTHRINWGDVLEIKVVRPPNTKSNRDYYFEFHRALLPIFKLRYGDIVLDKDRQTILNILSNRFSQWVDEEAVTTFAPRSERQSYTELWLAELSAPPKRDRLTPLDVGANLCDQKYQVLSKLGVGGQGTVYLAFSHRDAAQEVVVLKEFVLPIFPDKAVRKAAALRFQK